MRKTAWNPSWKIQNNLIFIQLPLVLEIQQFSGLAQILRFNTRAYTVKIKLAAVRAGAWARFFGGPMKVLSWSVALHIFRVRRGHEYSMLTEYKHEQSSLTYPNV